MFNNMPILYDFNCLAPNSIFITGGNIGDPNYTRAFQEHCDQLYAEDKTTAKNHARHLWKQLTKQKTPGITGDLFFKMLLILQEDLKKKKMWLEFCSLIEKLPELRKMALDLIFTSTTSSLQQNNPNALLIPHSPIANPRYRADTTIAGTFLLREILSNSDDLGFATTFFSYCKKSIANLTGGSLLRPTLHHHSLAQIIFNHQLALKKILERDLNINQLATLIANAPPPALIHDVGIRDLLLGTTLDNDYFSELFTKIFSHPTHLQTLLNSGLLTQAAKNSDYTLGAEFQAIEKIRQYFYQNIPNLRLAAYLKKHPQVFAQLAGENGEHVAHLCNLSSNPIKMAQFFAGVSATRELFAKHTESVTLDFGEYYSAKHIARLLTTKSGGHPLFHYHDENLSGKKRLTLELCVTSNNTLWKKYRKIYQQELQERPVALHDARLAIDQSFKVFRQKPSCMSMEASILVASSSELWKKISTPRWFEFAWMKKFKQRKKQLLNNPIFFARFQLGKHATWQEITARLIAVCDNSEGFFKQDSSDFLKQLICCFAAPTDLGKLTAQYESLKTYATTHFNYQPATSSKPRADNPASETLGGFHCSRDNPSEPPKNPAEDSLVSSAMTGLTTSATAE